MITANVWERVVRVEVGRQAGTGFTIDRDGTQLLVTARHLVDAPGPMGLYVRGHPVATQHERLTLPVPAVDVAVFRLREPITPDLPLKPEMDGIVYGQDAFFLGFPLGLTFDIGPAESFPLVKRATISATNHQLAGRAILLLDGWNNPGFSGGPVVFRPAGSAAFSVCGVVTGYRWQPTPVVDGASSPTGAQVLANSGIIIAEEITRVLEAL